MGKSHRAQREALVRPADKTRIQTQVTADDKENPANTPIFKVSKPAGESNTVPTFTSFIKSYQPPTGFMVAKQCLGLETQRAARVLLPPTGYGA